MLPPPARLIVWCKNASIRVEPDPAEMHEKGWRARSVSVKL
jgi:hypothetical protein